MRREVIRVEPLSTYLERWKAPTSVVIRHGDTVYVWRGQADADAFAHTVSLSDGTRLRQVRVVRDYGMFDRREAPQYYPDVPGSETRHA